MDDEPDSLDSLDNENIEIEANERAKERAKENLKKQIPLTKPKRVMSEKQKENFKKAQEKRAASIKLKKEQKILEAQKALLEKEGLTKSLAKNKPKINDIETPIKKKVKKQIIYEESSTEEENLESSESSSSEEEIVIIKKKSKQKIKEKVNKIPPVKNIVQRPIQQNLNDWSKYFL